MILTNHIASGCSRGLAGRKNFIVTRLLNGCLAFCVLASAGMACAADEPSSTKEIERPTPVSHEFELKSLQNGMMISVRPDQADATVICFLGTDCPLVKLYTPRLSSMATEFQNRGVRFLGINSNRQDTEDDIRSFLADYDLSFPLLRDEGNLIADVFGASRTPEVFVLDRSLQVVYRGRIDDQYAPGVNRPMVSRHDLREAIEDLTSGRPVQVTVTEPVGCMIGKVRKPATLPPGEMDTQITFTQHVSRVLQKHCIECHRIGDIGPFSLESYDEAVGWAETMAEVVENGRMPPWHADEGHRAFANARAMPDTDRKILRDWIRHGLPQGDPSHLPPARKYATGWQLGKAPDLELPMRDRPFQIPAEGTVEYQYFVVDPGLTEEKWVTAAQVIPGNRSVVHHAIVFIRPPDDQPFRGVGWLTAYVPGQRMIPMPPGHARRVPAGSKFVFQMHYTTNGTAQEDLSTVGMTFTDRSTVTDEVITLIGLDQDFEIPPHTPDHSVSGRVRWMPKNGRLLAIAPHMHVRGKSFVLQSESGGVEETLLSVPRYDFNWQHSYVLSDPLPLNQLDELKFTATFDNSSDNPFNPDPSEWVNWGDQTWEEMAVVFLEVSDPVKPSLEPSLTAASKESPAGSQSPDANAVENDQRVQAFVEDFFTRLDKNGDGIVVRPEVPISVRSRFRNFDTNGDGQVSRDEVRALAVSRFTVD